MVMKRAASDTSKATDPSWDFIEKILFDKKKKKKSTEQYAAGSSNQACAIDEC